MWTVSRLDQLHQDWERKYEENITSVQEHEWNQIQSSAPAAFLVQVLEDMLCLWRWLSATTLKFMSIFVKLTKL